MEKVVDSGQMCKTLIECMEICPTDLKKEIISFLPEIIEDKDHEV